jgi:hypothetical protein
VKFDNGFLGRGVIELRTVKDMGTERGKKTGKSGEVLYGLLG